MLESENDVPIEVIKAEKREKLINPLLLSELESLPFSTDVRKELLQVELGIKPATNVIFGSEYWREGETPNPLVLDGFEELLAHLEKSELFFNVSPDEVVDPNERLFSGTDGELLAREVGAAAVHEARKVNWRELRRVVTVSNDPDNLALLIQAYQKNDARSFGEAYGFPASAIEAYCSDNLMPFEEQVSRLSTPEDKAFVDFRFSKTHWKEELAYARTKTQIVKENSPLIYQQKVQLYLA